MGKALLLVVTGVPFDVRAAAKNRYELRGKILQLERSDPGDPLPVVFLQGSITPFTAQTVADQGGQFKFKNLHPGIYTLIVAVPRQGDAQQTVEVGPSFADGKGRVAVAIYFERKTSTESSSAVSATELSISDKARREYEKAQDRLGKHDVAGAVDCLKKAVDLAPQYSVAWNNLGTIAYQSKEYEKAEKYFREALRQDSNSYPPLVNLGGALLSLGKAAESLPVNLQAVQARPNDALAHSQLGQSHFLLGQLEPAEKHLKQAKALDPHHFSFPQLMLAEVYGRKQDHAALVRELEEFLRYHPDSQLVPGIKKALEGTRTRLKR